MSLTVAELSARLVADTSQFTRAMRDADDHAGRFSGTLGKVGLAIGGALSVGAIVNFGKASIAAFEESEKVAAQTEAAIKSTGGAAKVTAGHVSDLAGKLSMMSGVDDEVIQKGENMLLTFTNIKNGVGKTNDIFDQATRTALDMSVALGQDSAQSAMMLGKALNDPIAGVGALRRVGVQLTDQQEEQIKKMMKAGDVMGAQKVILKELQTEFGGSAKAAGETFAGQMDILKVRAGNFMEMVGSHLLPALVSLTAWMGKVGSVVSDLVETFVTAFRYGGDMAGQWTTLQTIAFRLGTAVRTIWATITDLVETFVTAFKYGGDMAGQWTTLQVVAFELGITIRKVADFLKDNWKAALAVAGAALLAFLSPIALVVAAVVAAYLKFEWFRDGVHAVADFLINTVWPAIKRFAGYIDEQFSNLADWVRAHWDQIKEAIEHTVNAISAIIGAALDVIKAVWHAVGDDLLRFAAQVWEYIRATVENGINLVRSIIETVMAIINGDWGKAWDGIKGIVGAVWDQIKAIVNLALDAVRGILGGAMSAIAAAWGVAWDGIKGVASGAVGAIVGFFASMPGRIFGAVGDFTLFIRNSAQSAMEWIRGKVDEIVRFFLSIPGRIANVGKDILSKLIPDLPGAGIIKDVIGHIPGFVAGGNYGPGPMIVGEKGPELLIPRGSGTIIPNSALTGGAPAMAAGNTYYITVQALDTSDGGQKVVELIAAYERRNGTGWRT
jgi:phage-related protein